MAEVQENPDQVGGGVGVVRGVEARGGAGSEGPRWRRIPDRWEAAAAGAPHLLGRHAHRGLVPPPPPTHPCLQVPAGSLPRTMEVVMRGDQVESIRPGDKAVFSGMLAVVPNVAALT